MSRPGDLTWEIDGPEASFGVINGDYSSDKISMKVTSFTDGVTDAAVPDEAYTTDLGGRLHATGLAEGQLSWTSDVRGQGTAAGDGTQASETGIGRCIASCLGGAQSLSTGDTTTATSHTTTVVTETNAGRHEAGELALFTVGSNVYMRPIWSRASGALTLGMALPSAPDSGGGEVINGTESIQYTDSPSYSIQGRKIRGSTYLDRQFLGIVTDLSMPQAAEGEIQKIEFTGNVASFSRGGSYSQTDPGTVRPAVVAGGEFLIAKSESAAATKALSYVGATLSVTRGWEREVGPNNANGLDSSFGWRPSKTQNGPITLELHLKKTDTPPAACDASTWEEMFQTPDSNDRLQVLLAYTSGGAGRSFGVWLRDLILLGWEEVDFSGVMAQKLMFGVETGFNSPPLVMATA